MNEPEANFEVQELKDELDTLRTLLSVSLVLLIVFGLSVNVYLLKQVSGVRTQVETYQRTANSYNGAKVSEIWSSLVNYSKTHPGYVPVIANYSSALSMTMITSTPPPKR